MKIHKYNLRTFYWRNLLTTSYTMELKINNPMLMYNMICFGTGPNNKFTLCHVYVKDEFIRTLLNLRQKKIVYRDCDGILQMHVILGFNEMKSPRKHSYMGCFSLRYDRFHLRLYTNNWSFKLNIYDIN